MRSSACLTFPYSFIFLEQKIDGKALFFLSREGSFTQLDVCSLSTVGDQMRLKELVHIRSPRWRVEKNVYIKNFVVTNISLYACNKNQVYIKEGLIQFLNCFQSDEHNFI